MVQRTPLSPLINQDIALHTLETMPALQLFGQKTCVAGDDLLLTCIVLVAIRIVQLVCVVPLTQFVKNDNQEYEDCLGEDAGYGQSYAIFVSYNVFSYILLVLGVILELGIGRATGKGSPTQPEERYNVRRLCHFRLIFLSVIRVITMALGIRLFHTLTDREDKCGSLGANRTYFVILLSTQIVEVFFVATTVIYFVLKFTPVLASAKTKWNMCCRCCMMTLACLTCSCLRLRQLGDFRDIVMVLADYFDNEGMLDIVFSDIVVAFLLLMREQRERKKESIADGVDEVEKNSMTDYSDYSSAKKDDGANNALFANDAREEEATIELDDQSAQALRVLQPKPTRNVLSGSNPADKVAIAEGARFVRYARAMYAWKLDLLQNPISSCATFGSQLIRSVCSMESAGNVEGDNCLGLSYASLVSFANLESGQVRYVSFVEGIGKIPFCVLLDHEWKSVVISIRGSMSLEDAVSDISISPKSLEACGERYGFDGRLCYAHAGMLEASEWIYDELERRQLLEELLLNENASCVGYKVRIVGHSFGAGCASILALLMRPKFPDIRALCFGPPGCVLSHRLVERSKEYATSFVLGNDIVPRLSQESMENLRDEVLEMIARIKVPKQVAVFASRRNCEIDKVLYPEESMPASKFTDQLNEFHMRYEKRK